MCEGFSLEDALVLDAAAIEEYGYIVVGVTDSLGPAWAYTIGLLDRADHPELIVVGPEYFWRGRLLNEIGRRVLAGERFASGDRVQIPDGVAEIGVVHPIQYELTTFNVWHNLERIGAVEASSLQALQVFAPQDWFCEGHQHPQPALSDPACRIDGQ